MLTKRLYGLILGLFTTLFTASIWSAEPRQYAVELSATVLASPAQIQLNWKADSSALSHTVYRKAPTTTTWSQIASLGGTAVTYIDTSVVSGTRYEYKVQRNMSGLTGTGYIYAGINLPLVDSRGKVVLVVDTTYMNELANELATFEQDLRGDGWTVVRQNVARNASVTTVKAGIKSVYQADPSNTKAVLLFGHVPVPYSGANNPDGHPDHYGAWPADVFYGEMDGSWTDSSVNTTVASRVENRNVPGDGKFDQTTIPTTVELTVGRVDLSNMTCFANKTPSRSELDLLRAYLVKNHAYRHKAMGNLQDRALIADNFGDIYGENFASTAWRSLSPLVRSENLSVANWGSYFWIASGNFGNYLWSYGCGGGSYTSCGGVGYSDDFATTEIQSVFTMFFGSYFGDWDVESSFLRAPLGSGLGLTAIWAGRPQLFFHHMGLGETVGFSTLVSQNNKSTYTPLGEDPGKIHLALMGDPTLRMYAVAPPTNVVVSTNGTSASLTWSPSGEIGLVGYHVYRAANPAGPFERVTSQPVTAANFSDSFTGSPVYMVKAIKYEVTPSGTFTNASQGSLAKVSASTTTTTTSVTLPAAPSNFKATPISSTEIQLTWTDNSTNELSFRLQEKVGTNTYVTISNPGANQTSFLRSGLRPGTKYTYRIRAYNKAGYSDYVHSLTVMTPGAGSTSSAGTTAVLKRIDTTTQGTWQGIYGSEGYSVLQHASAIPSYATLSLSGNSFWTWQPSTTSVVGLQKMNATDRIAACAFSDSVFQVSLKINDSRVHQVAFYLLDYDALGRSTRVEVVDAQTGNILSQQAVSQFVTGKYVAFNISGDVIVRFVNAGGLNTVLSGIFFDPAG